MFDQRKRAPISVLIADDHQLVRDMMHAYISGDGDFHSVVAKSYDDALSVLKSAGNFDVILLDAKMPGMDGVVSIESMVKANPESAVVLFSGTSSDEYVQEALFVGAKGYIPKTLPFQSLLSTIRLIASGEKFVPSSFSSRKPDVSKLNKFNLSLVEMAVLRRVCIGWSNKEIARDTGTSEITIKMHMRSICSKLEAKNRTQAAVIALREGIT